MDLYYTRKLLAVAHNKLDNFIAHRFQLLGWQIGSLDDIKVINHESMIYKHRSSKNPNIWYLVDMQLGMCECDPTKFVCACMIKRDTSRSLPIWVEKEQRIALEYKIVGMKKKESNDISNYAGGGRETTHAKGMAEWHGNCTADSN